MAAGGTFTPGKEKIRPGNYINFQSSNRSLDVSEKPGIVVIPLFNHPYGKSGEFIEITSENVGAISEKLGMDIDSNNSNMLLIREALKACDIVKAYVVVSEGTKATGTIGDITATAKYAGTRGNAIRVSITENVMSNFDLAVFLDNEKKYEYSSLSTIGDVIALNCPYVDFSSESELTTKLTENAGVTLSSGTDGTSAIADFTKFLDALDYVSFNAVCLPVESDEDEFESIATSFVTKVKYLRDNIGKSVVGVMAKHDANSIAIINVTNAPVVDDIELTAAQATAWVAGLYAASTELDNNTNHVYPGATGLTGSNLLSHEKIEEAILNGEFVFTLSDSGEVVVEYDINSLVTPDETQDESYKKNRVIRTFDAVADMLKSKFPIGKYSASENDFDVMDGIGAAVLSYFENEGALENVSEGDFAIDRVNSKGDTAYFNVAIQAVDSIVKSYFTIATR